MDGIRLPKTTIRLAIFCWVAGIFIQSAEGEKDDTLWLPRGDGSGSASGDVDIGTVTTIPTCSRDDEFLTSNGVQLLCRRIPPCTCFVDRPEQIDASVPLPPTGCPVYGPPLRGATTCYLDTAATLMFCSVYCDHNFEFLSTPLNPYSCGPSTNFQWVDLTQRAVSEFPECTAHRLTIGTIHSLVNYLPSPCYGLTDHTILAIMGEFHEMLRNIGFPSVPVEDIFMQCPSFDGRVYLYNDVMARATHKRRKRDSENESSWRSYITERND